MSRSEFQIGTKDYGTSGMHEVLENTVERHTLLDRKSSVHLYIVSSAGVTYTRTETTD